MMSGVGMASRLVTYRRLREGDDDEDAGAVAPVRDGELVTLMGEDDTFPFMGDLMPGQVRGTTADCGVGARAPGLTDSPPPPSPNTHLRHNQQSPTTYSKLPCSSTSHCRQTSWSFAPGRRRAVEATLVGWYGTPLW